MRSYSKVVFAIKSYFKKKKKEDYNRKVYEKQRKNDFCKTFYNFKSVKQLLKRTYKFIHKNEQFCYPYLFICSLNILHN